jgi:DNA modification methylase
MSSPTIAYEDTMTQFWCGDVIQTLRMLPAESVQCVNFEDSQEPDMWNYWVVGPKPLKEAHFATFPPAIPEKCIKAGSREGDIILDPFSGAVTTNMVAQELGRRSIGIEINQSYIDIGLKRLGKQKDEVAA